MTHQGVVPRHDYESVSETPGDSVLPTALEMVKTRYAFAAAQVRGNTVVEVACGSGHGLGILSTNGRQVVGVDLMMSSVLRARRHYGDRVELLRADAAHLPLLDGAVDSIVMFEAIYYLQDISKFLSECGRVTRPSGRLVMCWPNPSHFEFVRGAYTFTYPTVQEMRNLLTDCGWRPEMFGAYPASPSRIHGIRSLIKRLSGRLGIVPAGMRAKAILKRVFYGKLVEFPPEVVPADVPQPSSLQGDTDPDVYRVLYCVATRAESQEAK